MKLDIRPVTALTREILATSDAWMFVHTDGAGMHFARHVGIAKPDMSVPEYLRRGIWIRNGYPEEGYNIGATCYPCKAYAPFEPIPWPLMPGEVEIEEWRTLGPYEPEVTAAGINRPSKWVLDTVFAEYLLDIRRGYHPAPRRQINPDGTETPVWVWEADQ